MRNTSTVSRWLALILIALAAACSHEDGNTKVDVIRIGVLPDQDPQLIAKRYAPLLEYLSQQLGLPCKLVVPDTYGQLLELFKANAIDLAYFGGVTFVKAQEEHGAVPLVMRDIDVRFTSYFLVRTDSRFAHLKDCKEATFSFGSILSTSGHFMPRYFIKEQGIHPESFFSQVLYSGAHDKTIHWVRDGRVDVGVANAKIVSKMFDEGQIKPNQIRVLWETPPYVDYVWALQPNLAPSLNQKLRNAFLALTPDNPTHAKILDNLAAGCFLPAVADDFAQLREIIHQTPPPENAP